ncbi:MAG: molybdopterin molybdotransferase MoeA [Candidatus Bathyarchaeia archaeon]
MAGARLKGFKETVKVDEALKILSQAYSPAELGAETVALEEALGRVLAADLAAPVDLPAFDRSAMDGYAVVAEDTFGASQANPVVLKLVGQVTMGVPPEFTVRRGEAAETTTGAPMPQGADAVLMLEYARRLSDTEVEAQAAVTPGENVSRRGEDVAKGEAVLKRGTRLKPWDLALIAALGLTHIAVARKPKVALLSTGSELTEPGVPPRRGEVIDVNRLLLSGLVRELGGETVNLGIAEDSLSTLAARMKEGLERADLVLVTGGTSVGRTDLVPEAINSLGKPGMLLHGLSLRPGRPTGVALVNGKPVVSLPGFPVSAAVAFQAVVEPLLLRMLGAKPEPQPTVIARMTRRVPSAAGSRTVVRVVVKKTEEGYVAEPLRAAGSGILSSLVRANGLLIVPEEKEGVERDELVEVRLLRAAEAEPR